MKYQKTKECIDCGITFIGNYQQKRCGSKKNKIGCSWKHKLKILDELHIKYRSKYPNVNTTKGNIIRKLGNKCNKCGVIEKDLRFFDIDHIIPRCRKTLKESSNVKMREINNLQILCPNCHRWKTILDRENGLTHSGRK